MDLQEFFAAHPRVALAFSGGTDSAYLLYAARAAGVQVGAYYLKTAFQPAFEREDARRLAAALGVPLAEVALDILSCPGVAENPPDRCYHCKRAMFAALMAHAAADGYDTVIDGTNASDRADDRPGMRAIRELGVLSPLQLCGITKEAVRRRSRAAGLFTWDKPAYACLATRVPAGTAIRPEDLERVERGEAALMERGYRDLRLRLRGSGALLQLPEGQLDRARGEWDRLLETLRPWFDRVELDSTGR